MYFLNAILVFIRRNNFSKLLSPFSEIKACVHVPASDEYTTWGKHGNYVNCYNLYDFLNQTIEGVNKHQNPLLTDLFQSKDTG